uniref:Ras-GEF domain-containing protein n=1 Tax=Eptatretus burgeri TaxID=7764 RepID=A0A8C4R2Q1_EPTBU
SLDGRASADPKRKSYDAVLFDVLRVFPEDFASQITLLDAPVFKAIQPEELSSCGWNRKEKRILAPNVVAFTRHFNHVTFWVVRAILEAQTLKIRAEILSHFIKVAKVSLLKKPIPFCLSRRDRSMFDKLEYLTSKEGNFARLRDYIRSLKMTPCIPYLGIYLSDITYIDSAYPASDSILENEQRSLHMNNVLRVISDFQQFCHYGQLPHVQKYLHSVQYIEELQKFVEDDNYKYLSLYLLKGCSHSKTLCACVRARVYVHAAGASDASGSPQAVHRRTTAPEPLVLGSPISTPPTSRHPCCHRKSRSLGSNSLCPHVGVETKSMTLPAVRPRHLLDDSVMDLSPLPRPIRGASLASGLSLGTLLMDLDSIPSLPSPCVFTIEGPLKRRTLLKEGRRPTVRSWARFWVVLCGACLYYYPAKALRASERKHVSGSVKSLAVMNLTKEDDHLSSSIWTSVLQYSLRFGDRIAARSW